METEEVRRIQRLLLSNPEEQHRAWNQLFMAIPVRIFNPNQTKRGWLKVGYTHCRQAHSGVRFTVAIWQSPRGELCSFVPRSAVLDRDSLRGDRPSWKEQVTFDSSALKESFLDWALKVWQNAVIDGSGLLPFVSQRLTRYYAYHYVSDDGHLEPNALGEYPWTKGRVGPGDAESARQAEEAGDRREAQQGGSEEYSDEDGFMAGY